MQIDPSTVEMNSLNQQNAEIFKQLVSDPIVRSLPERLFVSNFLPFFAGELDPKQSPDFYSLWISIAGSPMAELDIVDDRNTPLFRVPGLIDSSIINPNRENKSGMNFADVVIMAKLYGNMTPAAGANALNKGLSEKYRQLQAKSPTFETNVKRWYEILKRYGKTKEPSSQTTVQSKTPQSNIVDDELEY